MRNKKYLNASFISILTGFFLFFPSAISALTAGGVGGYPAHPDPNVKYSESWFIYNLDTGESKEDALLVVNNSNEEQTLKLYSVDALPNNQGNFALRKEDEPREGIGAWMTLSETVITLRPGEQREIPFTIAIPENADVGEHAGGIIIQKAQPGEVEASDHVGASIVTRVGIRVYETVPGEIIYDLRFLDFSVQRHSPPDEPPYYNISARVVNRSNVSLNPTANLVIEGWGKEKYFARSKFRGGFVFDISDLTDFFSGQILSKNWRLLRESSVTTNWQWPVPAFGRYTFRIDLIYATDIGPKTVSSPTRTIWVVPWVELAALAALFVLFVAWILYRRVFATRRWREYTIQPGEQLAEIAQRAGVNWKRLAQVNKLKQPIVKAGETILAPPNLKTKVSTNAQIKRKSRTSSASLQETPRKGKGKQKSK